MANPERNKSGENPTQEAFGIMFQIFEASSPSMKETKGDKRFIELGDGTKITMSRYLTREIMDRPTGVIYAITVNIFKPHLSFLGSFTITERGLVKLSTGKKITVSLQSHLFPQPNQNLQVTYEGSESEKPLTAFRNASKLLVGWVKEMVDKDESLPCPVTIAQKTNKPNSRF